MMDPISKDTLAHVSLDPELLASIRQQPPWHLCRRNQHIQLVHIAYGRTSPTSERTLSRPLPLCGERGTKQDVKFPELQNPQLCGVCHRRLVQIGAL